MQELFVFSRKLTLVLCGLKCGARGTQVGSGHRSHRAMQDDLGQWDGDEQVKDVGRLAAWTEREESALTHRFLA